MSPQTRKVASTMSGRAAVTYPLDDLSGVQLAYSTRRLLTSYEGNCFLDETDTAHGFVANGDLNTSGLSGGEQIKTWYDQSSNGYDTTWSATSAYRPFLTLNGINSKPTIEWGDIHDVMDSPVAAMAGLSAATIFAVWKLTGAAQDQYIYSLLDSGNSEYGFVFRARAGTGAMSGMFGESGGTRRLVTSSTTYTFTNPHILVLKGSNGNPLQLFVDGVEPNYTDPDTALNIASSFTTDGPSLGEFSDSDKTGQMVGYLSELIIFNSALSDADRNTVESDESTYFNI